MTMAHFLDPRVRIWRLTERQEQMVELLTQGKSMKTISIELGISEQGVKNALRTARLRTGAKTNVQLAVQFELRKAA